MSSTKIAKTSGQQRSERNNGDGIGSLVVDEQLGQMLSVLMDYKNGRFDQRLPTTWTGVMGKMADSMNDVLALSERRAQEISRVCRVVGGSANFFVSGSLLVN